ncbi:hypothetical protein [Aquimarina sp. 2201CG14-23]|uniref:hypothetical protein n=1 Tax=Aquimarina mycalae TaxID=3040073 RepID=UPI0024782487|nr:hypothetical protein [Aquimarina sp. 2201CG14-23]MDH7444277.1 hypothetical protein [Aquimarina sp. 2201CG14-23]
MRFLFISTLFICLSANAQLGRVELSPEAGRLADMNTFNGVDIGDGSIKGSPFYLGGYKLGEVFVDGSSRGKTLLRYDGVNDELQFQKDNETYNVVKKDKLKAIVDKTVFKIYTYEGEKQYFITYNTGKNSLLLKPKKKFVDVVKAQSGYSKDIPAKFVDQYKYFILKNGEIQPIKLKKKDVLKVLSDKKSEIESFVSSKKLGYKKEKDLIKVMDYYNTL